MLSVDKFVLLDDVQYTKGGFSNRVKVKAPGQEMWITVPIKTSGHFGQLIMDVELCSNLPWKKKILGKFKTNYSKAEYFNPYYGEFEFILQKNHKKLIDLNVELLRWLIGILGINIALIHASDLKVEGVATTRLVNICKCVGADRYICGAGGNKYQDANLFAESKISLELSTFKHPIYRQMGANFMSGLSILDLVFNYGFQSKEILKSVAANGI